MQYVHRRLQRSVSETRQVAVDPAEPVHELRGGAHGVFTHSVGPVCEQLVLPDRHTGLRLVDEPCARIERLAAVRRAHGGDERQLPDPEVAHPVQRRSGEDPGRAPACATTWASSRLASGCAS